MTTPEERPAGRPTCGARPAGALPRGGRNRAPVVLDPSMIRQALKRSDVERLADVAAALRVSVASISRWRERRASAAAAGQVWPSDADVAYWEARQPERRRATTRKKLWELRTARAGGPMTIDSTGVRRRLQALTAVGWRYGDVGQRLGVHTSLVGRLAITDRPVLRDTAAAIAAVYDELSMTPGPSRRNRALALNRGWAPPLAWDDESIDDPSARPLTGGAGRGGPVDEVAVARAMRGDRVPLRPAERAEAVRRLTAGQLSAAEIADRLDISKRSVVRRRGDVTSSRRSA